MSTFKPSFRLNVTLIARLQLDIMDIIPTPAAVTNTGIPGRSTASDYISNVTICPKCGQAKGLPITHDEKPATDQLLKIQRGELLWVALSASQNPYRLAANYKCIWCEFEWCEQYALSC